MRTIHDIVLRAAQLSKYSPWQLVSRSRKTEFARIRFAIALAAKAEGHTSSAIGANLNRDHSSILHGQAQARALLESDPAFREFYDVLASCEPLPEARKADLQPKPSGAYRQVAATPYIEACRILDTLADDLHHRGLDHRVPGDARAALWVVAYDKSVSSDQIATWSGYSGQYVRLTNKATREEYDAGLAPYLARLIEDLGELV